MKETLTLDAFWEAWPLLGDSVLAGTIAGAALGLLGVYVVLRRLVFLSAAISQAASLGVAGAFYLQLHLGWSQATPGLVSVLTTLLAVVLVMRTRNPARRDATLGVVFLAGAAGTLGLATRITAELADIKTLLFGVAVAVVPEDFTTLCWALLPVVAIHAWWARGFAAASFDPEGARVRGLPVALLEGVLFATLALTISVCTRILGALPTFAFSVLPALAALALAPNVGVALVLATVVGAAVGFTGYAGAFLYELPVPVGQTLTGLVALGVAVGVGVGLRRLR